MDYDNDFNEILPGLYLGCYEAIFGKKFKELKIGCIISLTPEEETPYKLDIECHRFPITSKSTIHEIKCIIVECAQLLETTNKNVYIHCYEGVSRSAICVLYHIHKTTCMSISDSYKFLKEKRNVNPNEKMLDSINLLIDDKITL